MDAAAAQRDGQSQTATGQDGTGTVLSARQPVPTRDPIRGRYLTMAAPRTAPWGP